MTEQLTSDRVRVLIAGNIYAKRALVRRFLEDDGFDVAGEVMTREDLLEAAADEPVDAIVVDEDLVPGSVDALRELVPDARIVVFTAVAPGVGPMPQGADGYLEKGIGLASLTAMLNGLMSETPAPLDLMWTQPLPPPPQERRVLAGLGGVAAAIVALAVFALAVFGNLPGGDLAPVAGPTSPPQPTAEPTPEGETALQLAFAELDRLRAAIESGQPFGAAELARSLMRLRDKAEAAGYSLFRLDVDLQSLLSQTASSITPGLANTFRSVFGDLIEGIDLASDDADTPPGDGMDLTGGTAPIDEGGTGGTAPIDTPTDEGGTGGTAPTDDGQDSGTAPTDDGQDSGTAPTDDGGNGFPGRGWHNGWENKPPDGGWKGDNPRSHGIGTGTH